MNKTMLFCIFILCCVTFKTQAENRNETIDQTEYSTNIETINKLAERLTYINQNASSGTFREERIALITSAQTLIEQQPKDNMQLFEPLFEPLYSMVGYGGIFRSHSETCADLLAYIGKPAVNFLTKKLKSNEDRERWSAIQILIKIGEPNALIVSSISPLVSDKDEYVRRVAIDSLGELGEKAKPAAEIIKKAFDDTSISIRISARIAYMNIGFKEPEHIHAIAKYLEYDENEEKDTVGAFSTAATAASALGNIGADALIVEPNLIEAMNSPKSQIRINAVGALGQIGANSDQTVYKLLDLLKHDPSLEVRRTAAGTLGRIGPKAKEAIPILAEILNEADKESQNDPNTDTTGWYIAARAVGNIGGSEAIPVLERALNNNDPDIRRTAAKALEAIRKDANKSIKE